MKIVLANGCFDLVHPGHVAHLKAAREMGDKLIVALTLDEFIKDKGPDRPIYPWAWRAAILRELRCVDEVVPSVSGVQAIREIRPQVFVKGIDYLMGLPDECVRACLEVGAEIRFTRSVKFSTTQIIQRIRE